MNRSLILRTLNVICVVGILVMVGISADKKDASQTLTGIVSDSMCGGVQHMMPNQSPAECTRECVKGGSKYILVVDKKVYTLEGHEAEVDKLAGLKASVTGTVKGDKVQVASVGAAK